MKVRVDTSNSDKISSQLAYCFEVISSIENSGEIPERVEFDFTSSSWFSPYFIVPFVCYVDRLEQLGCKVSFQSPQMEGVSNYLSTINFPYGLMPDRNFEWSELLGRFREKSFIPILNFPSTRHPESTKARERFLTRVNEILVEQTKLETNVKKGVFYIIAEMTENIIEHADCPRGWAMAQFYRSRNYLDFCIADNGISILGSYLKAGKADFSTYGEAVQAALQGESTKYDGIQRGTGIRSSKSILVNGLEGKFCLISGNAFYANGGGINQLYRIDDFNWQGTILALRIPRMREVKFDIYEHL